jgi:hypothetical protein
MRSITYSILFALCYARTWFIEKWYYQDDEIDFSQKQ